MEIEKKITIKLNHNDVINIIEEHLRNKGFLINDMEFKFKTDQFIEGFDKIEIDYKRMTFEGVCIEADYIEEKTVNKNTKKAKDHNCMTDDDLWY